MKFDCLKSQRDEGWWRHRTGSFPILSVNSKCQVPLIKKVSRWIFHLSSCFLRDGCLRASLPFQITPCWLESVPNSQHKGFRCLDSAWTNQSAVGVASNLRSPRTCIATRSGRRSKQTEFRYPHERSRKSKSTPSRIDTKYRESDQRQNCCIEAQPANNGPDKWSCGSANVNRTNFWEFVKLSLPENHQQCNCETRHDAVELIFHSAFTLCGCWDEIESRMNWRILAQKTGTVEWKLNKKNCASKRHQMATDTENLWRGVENAHQFQERSVSISKRLKSRLTIIFDRGESDLWIWKCGASAADDCDR